MFQIGQRVCWTDHKGTVHNGTYLTSEGSWATVSPDPPVEGERTVLVARLQASTNSVPTVPIDEPAPVERTPTAPGTYVFYVKLMDKTRCTIAPECITVAAESELSGRMRAARRFAESHDISMFECGIVVETPAQREIKVKDKTEPVTEG